MTMTTAREQIVIIGSGFAGLAMGVTLKRLGIEDFVILEQAERVGGTWRDNHYPGAACDVESHLYSFSFEPNPGWSRAFAPQAEIFAYLERCAQKYGLVPHIRFRTRVTGACYDEATGLWTVSLKDGEALTARVVISACGGLSRPATPDLPGLDRFAGVTFHSARWRHDVPLAGKTVAVIGTGASAIQIVPSIAPQVGQLHLFQRTPPWILPRPDRAITRTEQALFRALPATQKLARAALWARNESRAVAFVLRPELMRYPEKEALAFLARSVPDPALRQKLTPTYTMGCKRVLITNDYYPALCRPNVELVTDGIAEITPRGVRTRDGRERAVDALILATGFQAAEAAAPFPVRGRAGRDLDVEWQDGAEAYLGTAVEGFPNFFAIIGPNTGLGHSSMVLMIEAQARYLGQAVALLRARGLKSLEVRRDVQDAYNAELQRRLSRTVWSTGGCMSWYQTRTGKNTTLWPGFTFEFAYRTRRFDVAAYAAEARAPAAARVTGLPISAAA